MHRVIARNVGTLLRILPVARRRARRHFDEAARLALEADIPTVRARALLGLAMLAVRRRDHERAENLFVEAGLLAGPHSDTLTAKIDAARAGRTM